MTGEQVVPPNSTLVAPPLGPRVVREHPRDELAFYIDRPNGPPVRLAGDELNLPLADYTIASTLNGGYSEADASVLKVLSDHGIRKHAGVRVLLPDGRTVWRGRVESTPESSDSSELKLSCIGHQARLEDVKNVTLLGVDADLSGWEEAPRARRREAADNNQSVNGAFSVSVDEDGMSITMDPDRNVQNSAMGELWYLGSDDKRIAEVQYIASEVLGTNMVASIRAFDDFDGASIDDDTLTTTLAVASFVPSDPAKYVMVRDSPSVQVNKVARFLEIHAASVYGNHDLPRYSIEDLPDGLKFSDIIAYLIQKFQPLLSVGQVDESSFVMPHAVWLDPVSLGDVLSEGLALEHNRNWAVWEDFTYRRRQDMGHTWELRRSEGAKFVNSGEAAEPDVNGVLVVYTAKDGSTKWAGPPGSGADVTDIALKDTSPDNPVNASNVVGDRYLVIEADGLNNTKAIEAGTEALAAALRERFVGEIQVPRFALRDGVLEPTSLMRADDWVVDAEAGGKPMPLSAVNYSRSGALPATGTVDLPANRLDAELARQGLKPQRVRRREIRGRYRRMRKRRQRQRERAEDRK